ncbi:MAG: hypothetical protein IJ827_01085, partial [Lachnospiraceae bacterium]|nr:hypothetical protein [Lachnospiraceae bacterium]
MKKRFIKIISACLIVTMLVSASTYAMGTDALFSVLPVAGNARALGEGISVTALKAEKIKSARSGAGDAEKTAARAFTSDAVIDSVLSQAGDSINLSAKTSTDTASSSSRDTDTSSSSAAIALTSTYTSSSSTESSVTKTVSSDPE